jgi:hypothetical protein
VENKSVSFDKKHIYFVRVSALFRIMSVDKLGLIIHNLKSEL